MMLSGIKQRIKNCDSLMQLVSKVYLIFGHNKFQGGRKPSLNFGGGGGTT